MAAGRWRAAAKIAESQLGLITREQLAECSVGDNSILNGVRAGRLTRVHRGVFSLGPRLADPRADLLAAVLTGGPGAALSHRSAGSHQGLIKPWRGPIAVTAPTEGGRARRGVRIHRRSLQEVELTIVDRVPCTTPSRTILDLCEISQGLGERAIREAGANGQLDLADLHSILAMNHGRRGTARLRMLLEGRTPAPVFTRSRFELLTYELCARAGIPVPDMNVEIWAGGTVYECDCVWPAERLIVECDSRWHDNPVTSQQDAERDQALTLAGWRVYRIRWAQLTGHPDRVAATIRRLLSDQRRLLAAVPPG